MFSTESIAVDFGIKMAYKPGSDIGLFPFRYLSPFLDGGFFSDDTKRRNYKVTMLKVF